jgi:hypothetical protein
MTRSWRLVGALLGAVALLLALGASSALAVTGSEVAALPLRDSLKRNENPLSNSGKWTGASWAWEAPAAGVDTTTGWHPSSSSTLQAAVWTANSFSQPDAASVTMATLPGETDVNMLRIDTPSATTNSGYMLTWTPEAGKKGNYVVELVRLSAGAEKSLATVSTTLSAGNTIALSDNGSTLTIWKGSATSLTELKTVSDSTYSSGYATIEGGGSTGKLTEFKAGNLVAAPTFSWTAPVSPAASTTPKIAGSAPSGSTVKLYTNSTCTGTAVGTGTAAAFASPGLSVTAVSNNTTTNYYATATDSASDVSPCSSTHATYQNDASEILIEGSKLSDFSLLQECVSGRITEVADPLGSGKTVMSFEPHPTDVVTNKECGEGAAPTKDPRAWAVSKSAIPNETEFWLRARFLIPNGFPEFERTSWVDLMEVYGAPFEGPSPWNFEIKPVETEGVYQGDGFVHQRNESYGWDVPWYETLSTGKWDEVLLHEKFAEKGFVEEWFNGVQEKFFNPAKEFWNPNGEPETTKLEMKTRDFTNDGEANSVRIGQYRAEESFTPTPDYFEFVKVGKTKASVGG